MSEFGPDSGNMFGMPNMFGGINPNIPVPPMFNNTSSSNNQIPDFFGGNKQNSQNGINVDDLIKKIDAKIAEIEEEEKKEAENNNTNLNQKIDNIKFVDEKNNLNDKINDNEDLEDISDDQFFDDFFSDDE